MMTADQILAIPVLEPERLFGSPEELHERYHGLARRWHPDLPDGDLRVFAHVNELHDQAKRLVDDGRWHTPGLLEFTANGKRYRVRYFRAFEFELGKAYLGKTLITYVIGKEFADLAQNAHKIITGLRFPDTKTSEVMGRYLPKLIEYHETSTDIVVTIGKPVDLIRMRDLVVHMGDKIDAKHVAWTVSRMLNHASYLEWAGLTHNDLSLDSLFVCPEHHTVCLLGGWWYATPVGGVMTALPKRTLNHAPREVIVKKRASLRIDPELTRLTAREMLGDPSGVRLMGDASLPKPMLDWLRMSGTGSAVVDYTQWRERILRASFGERQFVKLPVAATDVYTELHS